MTDTDLITAAERAPQTEAPAVTAETPRRLTLSRTSRVPDAAGSTGSLSTMVLPELRALANQVGVKGTSGMRKGDLIAAIKEHQNGGNGTNHRADDAAQAPAEQPNEPRENAESNGGEPRRRERRAATRDAGAAGAEGAEQPKSQDNRPEQGEKRAEPKSENRNSGDRGRDQADQGGQGQSGGQQNRGEQNRGEQNRGEQNRGEQNRGEQNRGEQNRDDDDDRQGRRGRRFRDRRRRGERHGGEGGGGNDAELREDDVVQPVAGILDVLDNYAFVRTSGYLAGPNDVYVSMNMVRKNGLRRGDAVTGAVRVRQGRRRRPEPAAEVQPAGAPGQRQRRPGRGGQEPARLQQADPAVPEPAAAAGDHS